MNMAENLEDTVDKRKTSECLWKGISEKYRDFHNENPYSSFQNCFNCKGYNKECSFYLSAEKSYKTLVAAPRIAREHS